MTLEPNISKIRGVLFEEQSFSHCDVTRLWPSESLRHIIEQFWIVNWDLPAHETFEHSNVPHAAVHVTFELDDARPEIVSTIYGPTTTRFTRTLKGKVVLLGIKFQPGGFYPFLDTPVSRLRDLQLPIAGCSRLNGLAEHIDLRHLDSTIQSIESFFDANLPPDDPNIERVGKIVKRIVDDQTITSVDQVVQSFSIPLRSLQRLFQTYVGVSCKCIIQKHRIQESLERLQSGASNWQDLVFDLGYFDQAHFIKDFKNTIGLTPTAYLARIRSMQ